MADRLPSQSFASVRTLARRSLGLVAVLALLLVLALAALAGTISTMDEEAEALEVVGGQRMRTQRAALLVEKLRNGDEPAIARQRYRYELEHLSERLSGDARWLIDTPDVPPEVKILLATAWDPEAGVMARFQASLLDVLAGRDTTGDLNHREAMLFNEGVAARYQEHASHEVFMVKLVVTTVFLILLLGLALLYLLVLRPAVVMVRRQVQRQAALGDAIVQSGHGVLLLDETGKITFANTFAETLTEYPSGGLLGLNWGRLLFSAYGEETADVILQTAATGSWRGDVRMVRRGGVMIWAEMVASASETEGQYLVIFFDATARREGEAKLRQARERLAAALEAVDEGFALFDAEEKLILWNRKCLVLIPELEPWLVPGTSFISLVTHCWKLGLLQTDMDLDRYVDMRLAQFRAGQGQLEVRMRDGRILRITDRRTPEGGRVSIMADVTALNAGRDHLRRALEQAESANRSKSVFLSSVSHELRTPLNSILGFAQLLDAVPVDGTFGDAQRRAVNHILRAGRSLDQLVAQMLELADLERGALRLVSVRFDLAQVLRDALAQTQGAITQSDLFLDQCGCDETCIALGDPQRMAEVISHLLSNAVKFNRPQGRIKVTLSCAGERLRVEIADTGTGISADLADQIFSPFNRLGGEGSAISGTGISLTICRTLMQQMGGSIGFSSREGEGSLFWVELPRAPELVEP